MVAETNLTEYDFIISSLTSLSRQNSKRLVIA